MQGRLRFTQEARHDNAGPSASTHRAQSPPRRPAGPPTRRPAGQCFTSFRVAAGQVGLQLMQQSAWGLAARGVAVDWVGASSPLLPPVLVPYPFALSQAPAVSEGFDWCSRHGTGIGDVIGSPRPFHSLSLAGLSCAAQAATRNIPRSLRRCCVRCLHEPACSGVR